MPGKLIIYFFSSKKIYLLMRSALGLVFIVSGVFKLADLKAFAMVVKAFAILPPEFADAFSVALPVLELVVGFGILAGIRGSLFIVTALLLVFVGVLGYAIFMGYDIDCGCFGPNDPEAKAFSGLRISLVRDLFFMLQAAYLYTWPKLNNRLNQGERSK